MGMIVRQNGVEIGTTGLMMKHVRDCDCCGGKGGSYGLLYGVWNKAKELVKVLCGDCLFGK